MIYTEEDFKNKCKELDDEFVGTTERKHDGTIIRYICKKHRDKGIQESPWSRFRKYKNSCPYCHGRYKTLEDAQKLVKNKNIIFMSEYNGGEKPIKCHCNACGSDWISNRPLDLFRRDNGCPTCANRIRGMKRRNTQEQFENNLRKVNPNIEVIGKYIMNKRPIRCRCKIDGHEWESYPSNLLNGSAGCPLCNSSVGERKIVEFMEEHNIPYIRQKTFDGLADKKKLKFDVFDTDNNIAFEFQGEQHYFPIDFAGLGAEHAKHQFDELKKRDEMKIKYCEEHNIKLVCIPYWERDNISAFLLENIPMYKEKYIA